MRTIKEDTQYGLQNEEIILNKLRRYWNDEPNIQNTKDIYNDNYCKYDFQSDTLTTWELKSRRNTKTQYPTTIIPVHKVRDVDTVQYFVFMFSNALCYIKYDNEIFHTFNIKYISDYRPGRPTTPIAHYEIPVELLIDIP